MCADAGRSRNPSRRPGPVRHHRDPAAVDGATARLSRRHSGLDTCTTRLPRRPPDAHRRAAGPVCRSALDQLVRRTTRPRHGRGLRDPVTPWPMPPWPPSTRMPAPVSATWHAVSAAPSVSPSPPPGSAVSARRTGTSSADTSIPTTVPCSNGSRPAACASRTRRPWRPWPTSLVARHATCLNNSEHDIVIIDDGRHWRAMTHGHVTHRPNRHPRRRTPPLAKRAPSLRTSPRGRIKEGDLEHLWRTFTATYGTRSGRASPTRRLGWTISIGTRRKRARW
jgi:hypothetical protein